MRPSGEGAAYLAVFVGCSATFLLPLILSPSFSPMPLSLSLSFSSFYHSVIGCKCVVSYMYKYIGTQDWEHWNRTLFDQLADNFFFNFSLYVFCVCVCCVCVYIHTHTQLTHKYYNLTINNNCRSFLSKIWIYLLYILYTFPCFLICISQIYCKRVIYFFK